jgi:feruloyl esterase
VEGSTNYFTRVSEAMGGDAATQEFLRLYLVPGMGHCAGVGSVSGTSSPSASPETVPLPAPSQFFDALVNWVEQGQAPDTMVLGSSNNTVSLPACVYPKKVAYTGTGAITSADSYACKSEP